jgi:hypothetical protein
VLVAEGRQSDRTVARRFCAALTIRIGADMAALALPVEGVRRSAQGKARGGNSSPPGARVFPWGRARGWTVTTSRLYGGGDPARSQAAVIAPGSERAKPALHTMVKRNQRRESSQKAVRKSAITKLDDHSGSNRPAATRGGATAAPAPTRLGGLLHEYELAAWVVAS